MPLKAVVSQIEEVPEAQRSLYKQAEGRWVLDLDGGGAEDVAKLQGALDKERTNRGLLEKDLAKLRKDVDGLDPEKARAALKTLQDLEDKKLVDEGRVDELVASRTKQLIADHQNQVKQFQAQIDAEKLTAQKLNGTLRTLTLEGGIRELATKPEVGVRPSAVTDLITRMTVVGVGTDRVRWDLRDGRVVALKGEDLVYGKDPTKTMGLDEGLDVVRSEAPHLFEPSQGGNAQNRGGTSSGGPLGGTFRISREQARDPQVYRQARENAAKVGQTLVVGE